MRRKFAKLAPVDAMWLSRQPHHVQTLWFECVSVEQFGDQFQPFTTRLEQKSFQRARKILSTAGYLQFDFKRNPDDQRQIETWLVKNLHGATTDFWLEDDDQIPGQDSPDNFRKPTTPKIDGHHSPDKGRNSPDIGQDSPDISSETLSQSYSCSLSDFNQTESENLIICEQNPKVSSSDDSLRSTQVGGREEEKSSVLTKDLEVLQHPLSTDQDLGSHSNTNSSSTKTTPNTEPSCSSSQKKRLVSTSDDGSVELIRLRSPHVKPRQNTSRSHDDAPQAPWTPTNVQSHRNPTQSPLKPQLGGSQLESAIVELQESLQAVADDLEMTVEGGIDELCKRFAGLATETEVELLPVPREYPYYDRMSEWVLYENKSIVCFVRRGLETRRLTIGRFR